MKYFITSSLNIDNILSTESISPFSFYQKRSFGYERIEQLAQFTKFADHIILFSDIPHFTIEDFERENHPLVIQIDDEEQLANVLEIGECEAIKIFAYSNTIHINPTNCKLLFFTDKAKVLSKHNCLDSKLNKLINYFTFETITPSNYQLNDLLSTIDETKLTNLDIVPDDNLIDRAKGFIIGYYLGAFNDLPSDVALILAKQKRIYDIVAAKINNKSRLSESLDNELNELDKYLTENDPSKAILLRLWNEFALKNNLSVEQLNRILKELNCEKVAKNNFIQQNGIINYKGLDMFPFNLENYRQALDSYIRNLVYYARNKTISVMDEIQLSNYFEFKLKSEDEEAKLFNFILQTINEISDIDEVRTNKFEVLQKCGKKISEYFGKESQERDYWINLASNIKQSSPFDVKGINNIVLQSIAAFVLKGEDYESLTDYIATNAMTTYKYALAIWGAVTGYVNISRPLLEHQINHDNFERLYSDVNKLVFGRDLKGKLEYQVHQIVLTQPIEPVSSTSNESFNSMIWKTFDKIKKGLKNQDKLKDGVVRALSANENNTDCFKFIALLNDYPCWDKKTTAWKKMQQNLCPDYYDKVGSEKDNNSTLSFELPVGQYFYCDKNAWYYIEPLIVEKNAKKKIKSDLEWFQEDISKPNELRKYYKDLNEKDNNAVIMRFCRLKSGNDKEGKPKAQYFPEDLRKVIELKLKEIYNAN